MQISARCAPPSRYLYSHKLLTLYRLIYRTTKATKLYYINKLGNSNQ